jgi:hypothetical protein
MLPRNLRGRVFLVDFMKYAIEMGSGVMIYVPSFMKIGSGVKKLLQERYTESKVISQAYF